MSRITVDQDLCLHDGACVEVCPARFLAQDEQGSPVEVPEGNCILCGHCVAVCLTHAIQHADLPDESFLPAFTDWPSPATMDGFLMSRRSVREFKPEPVGRPTMKALLEVARRAPTASNSQKLHWIVVDGREKVHALAEVAGLAGCTRPCCSGGTAVKILYCAALQPWWLPVPLRSMHGAKRTALSR